MARPSKKKKSCQKNFKKAKVKQLKRLIKKLYNKHRFSFLNQPLIESNSIEPEKPDDSFVLNDLNVDNELVSEILSYILLGNVSKTSISVLILSLLK